MPDTTNTPSNCCSGCAALREELRAFLEVGWKVLISNQELVSDVRAVVDKYKPFLGDAREKKY